MPWDWYELSYRVDIVLDVKEVELHAGPPVGTEHISLISVPV